MRGRKPTPHNLKIIAGTDRLDRAPPEDMPEFDLVEQFPAPPRALDVNGVEMWSDLGPRLVSARVLQVVDLYLLEQLCVAWQTFRKLADAGVQITASDNMTLKALFSEFGMSPASRRKVASVGKKETTNRFADRGAENRPTKQT